MKSTGMLIYSSASFQLQRLTDPFQALLELCRSNSNGEQLPRKELQRRIQELLHDNVHCAHALDDNKLNTPLHLACSNPGMGSDLGLIGILIEASDYILDRCLSKECRPLTFGIFNPYISPTPAWTLRFKNLRGELVLHVACQNAGYAVTSQVMHYLIKANPTAVCTAVTGSGQLPIHEASLAATMYCVPLEIVAMLYQRWPESVKITNADGNLPIHLAIQIRKRENEVKETEEQCQAEIVKFLINCWPESVKVHNHAGRTPVELAFDTARACGSSAIHPVLSFLQKIEPKMAAIACRLELRNEDNSYHKASRSSVRILEPLPAVNISTRSTTFADNKHARQSLHNSGTSTTISESTHSTIPVARLGLFGVLDVGGFTTESESSFSSDENDEPFAQNHQEDMSRTRMAPPRTSGFRRSDETISPLQRSSTSRGLHRSLGRMLLAELGDSSSESESESESESDDDEDEDSVGDHKPMVDEIKKRRSLTSKVFKKLKSGKLSKALSRRHKPKNAKGSARPKSSDTKTIAKMQKGGKPNDFARSIKSTIRKMNAVELLSGVELLGKDNKFIELLKAQMPQRSTEGSRFSYQKEKEKRWKMDAYTARGSRNIKLALDYDSDASLSLDPDDTNHLSAFEQFVVRNAERIKRRIKRGVLKEARYVELFTCTKKIEHDFIGMLNDADIRYDTDSVEAKLHAACHIFQQFLNGVDVLMQFDEIFKEALVSEDAFTPVQVIHLNMENYLLSHLSPFATTKLSSMTAGQSAQLLSWSENFLEMTKEACPQISPNPKWRKHIIKLLDHYLEDGVRKETRELVANLYKKDQDDMRKNIDGYIVTSKPEGLMYIYHLQLEVAKEFLPKKYIPAVLGVCNEEIPKIVSGRIFDINENWLEISEARYCAIINDSMRLLELLESQNDKFFTKSDGIVEILDVSELEQQARLVESEMFKLSRAALDRLCDKIIHDLKHPVPFINSVGSVEWETDDDGTAIEVTTATIREYFSDLEEWLNPNSFGLLSRKCFNLIFENYVNYFFKNTQSRGVRDPRAAARRLLQDRGNLESYFDGEEFEPVDSRTGRLRSKQEIASRLKIITSISRLIDPDVKPRKLVRDIKRILEHLTCEGENESCILHLAGLNGHLTKDLSLRWLKAIARAQRAINEDKGKQVGSRVHDTFQIKIPDLRDSPYIYRVKISKYDIEKKLLATTVKYAEKAGKALHADYYTQKVMALTHSTHGDFSVPSLLSMFASAEESDRGHLEHEERPRRVAGAGKLKMIMDSEEMFESGSFGMFESGSFGMFEEGSFEM